MPLLAELQPNCKLPLKHKKYKLALTVQQKRQEAAPRGSDAADGHQVPTAGGDNGTITPAGLCPSSLLLLSVAAGPCWPAPGSLSPCVLLVSVGLGVRGVCALPAAPQTDTALEGWACFPIDFFQVYYFFVTHYHLKPSETTWERERAFADHKHLCTVLG